MSTWEDRFSNHAVFTNLKNFGDALTRARAAKPDQGGLEALDRLRNVHGHIQRRLEGCDPALVGLGPLNSIATSVQQAVSEVNGYANNKNIGHLNNANNHLDNALPQAELLPTIKTPADAEAVHEAVVRFRRSAGQHLSRLEKRIAGANEKIENSGEQLSSHSQLIKQQQAKLEQAIQTFTKQAAESDKERTKEFADLLANTKSDLQESLQGFKAEIEETLKEGKAQVAEGVESAHRQAAEGIKELESNQTRAKEIVGLIATTGMAGGYEMAATEERKRADTFRWIAVGSIVGIILFAVYALVSTVRGGFETETFIAKAFVSLTFGVLAAYAGRESERHRRRERTNARLHLELASIDAYLESLPGEDANAIKAAIADRIFGQPEPAQKDSEGGGFSPPSLLEFLKVIGVGARG